MALPARLFRVIVMVTIVAIFLAVRIINSEQRSGEGGDLSERDEEGIVDLSERVNIDAAEEHDKSS